MGQLLNFRCQREFRVDCMQPPTRGKQITYPMANRFFTAESLAPGSFVLDGAEAHHLAHVRRLGVGDEATLFNGNGREYRAIVIATDKRQVALNVVEVSEPDRELGFRLHVGTALPKGDRLDFLIEKLTELGATDFTPLFTERSIVVARAGKVEKMQRLVVEASKQCGRNVLMRVHSPLSLTEWCAIDEHPATKRIAHPGGAAHATLHSDCRDIAIAIGPEGGFTEQELTAASETGFCPVSLGSRLLRIETAALAAVAWLGSR